MSESINQLLKSVSQFIHNINEREKWFFFAEGELYLKKTKRKLLINNKISKEVVLEISHLSIHSHKKGIASDLCKRLHNLNNRYAFTVADRVISEKMQHWCVKYGWTLIPFTHKDDIKIYDYMLPTTVKL